MIGRKLSHFRVLEKLGAGGMGVVYRAEDERLRRDVALKVLPPELSSDPERRERFLREARAAAAVSDSGIAAIHDIGEEGGIAFIAMELVHGQTLRARLSGGALPAAEAVGYARDIAAALERAHSAGVVHRDLKPENVMVQPDGRVKLLDFGLAKLQVTDEELSRLATESPLTREGTILGTTSYMSPEQVRGQAVDARSDLFSLGVVLFESLTGSNPFRRATRADTMSALLRDDPSLDSSLGSGISAALSVILDRLLSKSPDDRYASAREVIESLMQLPALERDGSQEGSDVSPGPVATRWRLIGRDAELAQLRQHLEASLAGSGAVVLLGGEPGIGKTRLTEEVLGEARRNGCLCVVGHCYEGEGSLPYVPFVETLEHAARIVPPERFRRALGDAAPEVSRLMPELRRLFPDVAPPMNLPPEQQRRFLFNAYREFVERASAAQPLLVVLEDLHWADEPTLLLLLHIAQAVSSMRLLVVGTYRDVELDVTRPFASTLESMLRQHVATRLALRRLPEDGVAEMLAAMSGQTPPRGLARAIHDGTEGNPFFVEEVFQHLAEEGKLLDRDGRFRADLRLDRLSVPEGVRLVIGKRLGRLSEAARRTLTTASVIGRNFDLSLLEALENDPDAALDALEEAEKAHLVSARAVRRETRYGFAHELIRQTLAETLSLPRRQRLHARIAAAIKASHAVAEGRHVAMLAHHLYLSGAAADPDETVETLVAAAEQAREATAHEEALTHLDNALLTREGERSGQVADLLERRGRVLHSLGRFEDAVAALGESSRLAEALGDSRRLASACLPLMQFLSWQGSPEIALEEADRVLAGPVALGPPERSAILCGRSLALAALGEAVEAHASLEEAKALRGALEVAPPELDYSITVTEFLVCFHLLHMARLEELCVEVKRLARACGVPGAGFEIECVVPGAWQYLGSPPDAAIRIAALRDRTERFGFVAGVWFLETMACIIAIDRGELEAAEQSGRRAVALGQSGNLGWQDHSPIHLGRAIQCRGRSEEALQLFRRSAGTTARPDAWHASDRAALFLALAQERDPEALSYWRRNSLPRPVLGRENSAGCWISVLPVVEALALLGHRDEAASLRPWVEALLDRGIHGSFGTPVHTTAGIAAACAGDWQAAESHHAQAARHARELPLRCGEPGALAWHAEMLLDRGGSGDRDRARTLLGEAVARCEGLGMPSFARRYSERLDSIGRD